jgi:arylsulfatase A
MKGTTIGLILAAGLVTADDAAGAPAPNFVVILTEAQGWANTSVAMDDRIPESRSRIFTTPAVERLAREGMRFAHGYATSPRCTPSRAALFTGKSPAVLHMTYVGQGGRDNAPMRTALIPPEPVLELPLSERTVAELLKGAGYRTAHFGKWHVGRVDPANHGFDESDGPTSNGGPENVASPNPKQAYGMTERGIAFMTRASQAGQPFYLQLSHYPNQERKEGGGRPDPATVIGDADEIDKTVMLVLSALDRLELTGRTYVIYTSDHGSQGRVGNAPLSGGKGSVLEGGLRVPFLIRGPGIAANVCARVPVTACDLLPTIAELASVQTPLPAGIEGGSLVPVLREPSGRGVVARAREELVFHFPHYDLGNGGPASAILLGRYKLIRNYETGTRRLFDLERDPAEARDLAPAMPEKSAELDARLTAYLRAVVAQLAAPNPNYDPSQAPDPAANEPRERRGGKGGKKRG